MKTPQLNISLVKDYVFLPKTKNKATMSICAIYIPHCMAGSFLFFFLSQSMQLAGSIPQPGLNPGHGSESSES